MSPATALPHGIRTAAPAWSAIGRRLRFEGEAPLEVSFTDGRGRQARLAKAEGSGGTEWILPSGPDLLFVTARFPGSRVVPVGWRLTRP
jgi:hypothetical protein